LLGSPAKVVTCDRADRLERCLGEEGADAARVFAFPRTELDEIRGRQHQLELVLRLGAREHDPALGERLKCGRNRRDDHRAARLSDAMEQLDARLRQAPRISKLRQRDERTCDLRRRIEALRWVNPDTQPRHQRGELRVWKCLEDVDQA
jgi:hypothetical protein